MNMKRLALTFITCLGILLSPCCRRDVVDNGNSNSVTTKSSPTIVALIFCDVTNSLTKEENRKVGSIAADILNHLPKGSIFKLYPIQIQTQIPSQINIDIDGNTRVDEDDYQVVPNPPDSTKVKEYKEKAKMQREKWGELIQKGVDDLYDRLNRGPDNRTCILNALGFASNYIDTNYNDAKKYDVRMLIISDMIEECNNTPLPGRLVKMNKQDISNEIRRASVFRPDNPEANDSQSNKTKFKCNLAGVKIYCVFPAASDTPTVSNERRPNRDDVKTFWGEIFKGCGVKDEQLDWVDSGDLTVR